MYPKPGESLKEHGRTFWCNFIWVMANICRTLWQYLDTLHRSKLFFNHRAARDIGLCFILVSQRAEMEVTLACTCAWVSSSIYTQELECQKHERWVLWIAATADHYTLMWRTQEKEQGPVLSGCGLQRHCLVPDYGSLATSAVPGRTVGKIFIEWWVLDAEPLAIYLPPQTMPLGNAFPLYLKASILLFCEFTFLTYVKWPCICTHH